jgi:hypothetical protein
MVRAALLNLTVRVMKNVYVYQIIILYVFNIVSLCQLNILEVKGNRKSLSTYLSMSFLIINASLHNHMTFCAL